MVRDDGPHPVVGAELRGRLAPLFAGHPTLRAVISAVVEGRAGAAWADAPDEPSVARLDLGCYCVFGGDPTRLLARTLAAAPKPPCELVYGNDPCWRRLLQDVHGARVADRSMRDYSPSALSQQALAAAAATLADGFLLRRLDARLASQLDAELEPHALQVYASPAAFVADAFGFGAVRAGQLECAATAYAQSSDHVELAIATRPRARGLGLAGAVAARFLSHALEHGLRPHWNASNPVSQRLALRLGFEPADVCEVLYFQ